MLSRLIWTLKALVRRDWKTAREAMISGMAPLFLHNKYLVLDDITNGLFSWKLPAGDYLEFGVYRGRSFISAYKLTTAKNLNMHYYAFDSFEGLPDFQDLDKVYENFESGQYACSQDEFSNILADAGVDQKQVTLVPGFFDVSLTSDTVKALPIKRAAIAWVDCDLYLSTVPVLEYLTPLLTTGSFLVFDDWYSFGGDPKAGELAATNDWLEKNPDISLLEYRKFGVSGMVFLVQRT